MFANFLWQTLLVTHQSVLTTLLGSSQGDRTANLPASQGFLDALVEFLNIFKTFLRIYEQNTKSFLLQWQKMSPQEMGRHFPKISGTTFVRDIVIKLSTRQWGVGPMLL